MLYSITKKSVSRREIKKTKKIRSKAYKKGRRSSSGSSSDDSDSYSSLAINSGWDKYMRPAGHKDTNGLDHVVTNNLENNKYQSNEAISSEPNFDTSDFNLSSGTSDPLPVVTASIRGGKKHRSKTVAGLTCLWYSKATETTIKRQHTKHNERKMRSNKVENSTAAGVYYTPHDVKVAFCIPEFSIRKIINHRFHVNNDKVESGIRYDMIIGRDLMVHLGPTTDFKRQVLQWDGANLHMKEPSSLLGQSDLTKREMSEVVMQTAEPDSTREATERMVKILDSIYVKADLSKVADNKTQMKDEERTLLLSLIEDFKDLFDGNFGDWATDPVELELNPYSKPFNSRYYPVTRINKEIFRKDLNRLVEI